MGKLYYRALKEMAFVFRYIRYDKYAIKKHIYEFIDLLPVHHRKTKYLSYHFNLDNDAYFLNLNHDKWYNLKDTNISSHKSFLDLYDDVINNSSHIINELYEYIFNNKSVDLENLIGNYSYSTGLLIDKQKIKYK